MDQDVQKNAAMVEETTAATHNLKSQADALVSSVASFKVERSRGASNSNHIFAPRIVPARQRKIGSTGRESTARKAYAEPVESEWAEF